eukprot:766544-Hanusia_phi.AAC.4
MVLRKDPAGSPGHSAAARFRSSSLCQAWRPGWLELAEGRRGGRAEVVHGGRCDSARNLNRSGPSSFDSRRAHSRASSRAAEPRGQAEPPAAPGSESPIKPVTHRGIPWT